MQNLKKRYYSNYTHSRKLQGYIGIYRSKGKLATDTENSFLAWSDFSLHLKSMYFWYDSMMIRHEDGVCQFFGSQKVNPNWTVIIKQFLDLKDFFLFVWNPQISHTLIFCKKKRIYWNSAIYGCQVLTSWKNNCKKFWKK